MSERQWVDALRAEGYTRSYVWQDAPHAHYTDHTHAQDSAHVILQGQMTLVMAGQARTYGVGERVDVPAGAVHSATMGAQGCRYLIGERAARAADEPQNRYGTSALTSVR
jgi:uncharacterized protein YjlB